MTLIVTLIVTGFIVIFFNVLAYWHRDKWLYVLAAFACLLFAFDLWSTSAPMSILMAFLGIYNFVKVVEG